MTAVLTRQFQVFRSPVDAVRVIGPHVLVMAALDGVHIGHRALLQAAAEAARQRGLPVGAATFAYQGVGRNRVPALSSLGERLHLLHEAGMDFVVMFSGGPDALDLLADGYTDRIVWQVLRTRIVEVRAADLMPPSNDAGLNVHAVTVPKPWPCSGVSTLQIRDRLGIGEIDTVNRLLGRRYEVIATVREIANGRVRAVVAPWRAIPASGEYVAMVHYRSAGAETSLRTVVVVQSGDPGGPGHLTVYIDGPVDLGRLRIGFIGRVDRMSWVGPLSR